MLAQDYLSESPPQYLYRQSAAEVLKDMKANHIQQALVVERVSPRNDAEYLEYHGWVSLENLEKHAKNKEQFKAQNIADCLENDRVFLYNSQHIFDSIKWFTDAKMQWAPVLDMQERFLGAIGIDQALRCFAEVTASRDPGVILVLEIARNQYSPAQIASIIESNRSILLSLSLAPAPEPNNLYVNLKIASADTTSMVLGFERFGYKIAHVFADQNLNSAAEDHYNALMRYLDV